MRYDNIPPAIIRRALTVYLATAYSDMTPVYFRLPSQTDAIPHYRINWNVDEQDSDRIWEREEDVSITAVANGADDIYAAAVATTKIVDFFQRESVINDLNRIITYIESTTGDTIPYRFKYVDIMGSGDGVQQPEDAMETWSTVFVTYCITFGQESLPDMQSFTDQYIAQYDV